MNTSARHPHAGLLPEPMAQFTGVLLHHAEARMRQLDSDGHMVPVLCMDIELDGHLRNQLHVEQLFAAGAQHACEAAAHRYRKGTRVTVEAPVVGLRMVAANTTHIHVHHPEDKAA